MRLAPNRFPFALLAATLLMLLAAASLPADRAGSRVAAAARGTAPAHGAAGNDAPAEPRSSDVAFYLYTMSGASIEAIEAAAKERAMAATVGEFTFDDRYILAPELLDRYLAQRLDDFIAGVKVLGVTRGAGAIQAEVQVAVNRARLERDLTEKRFFYKPRRRPYFHVAIEENLDGATPQNEPTRTSILRALADRSGQPTPFPILIPSPGLDVDANQDLLYQALVACRRQGIELLVTGTIDCRLEKTERLYYTEYAHYLADVTLKLINVQDGRTLRTVSLQAKANDPDAEAAAREAMQRAGRDATLRLLDGFIAEWIALTQSDSDYRLLVRGIGPDELNTFLASLESSLRGANVFTRSFANGAAVLNLYYTGPVANLRRFISESRYPKFNVELFDDGRIKLSTLD